MFERRCLIVVSLAASLLMIGVGMIVALLPQRVLALSGSIQEVGHLASVFALSYLMLQLPIGRLADRFGAKPFLLLGYALCCLSGLVFSQAQSVEPLLLGRAIQGAGEAPIWALGPALLARAYPKAKGRTIGIYNAAIHAGLTLGPLTGILLFPTAEGSGPFLVFAVLCLAGGLLVLLALPALPERPKSLLGRTPTLRDLLRLLKAGDRLAVLCGILLYGAGYGLFVSVLPASLVLSKGFDAASTGLFFALFYLAISLSQLVVGPLSDRQGRRRYMVAGLAMASIGFATLAPLPGPWVYAPLALASFGLGVFCVASIAYLSESVPDSLKAATSGSYYLAWGLGYFLGPLAIGALPDPWLGYWILATLFGVQAVVLGLGRASKPDGL